MALALIALVAPAVAAVSSLTISPSDIASGGTATGTVTLDASSLGSTVVSISSSKLGVVTVPPSVLIPRGARTVSFKVNAVAGAAGCTAISARVGKTPPRAQLLYVQPPPEDTLFTLSLSSNSTLGGASLTGTVGVAQGTPGGPFVLSLSSDNSVVSVPASVTVSLSAEEGGYVGSTSFPITTRAITQPTCAVITARSGTSQSRALLKLIPFDMGMTREGSPIAKLRAQRIHGAR